MDLEHDIDSQNKQTNENKQNTKKKKTEQNKNKQPISHADSAKSG